MGAGDVSQVGSVMMVWCWPLARVTSSWARRRFGPGVERKPIHVMGELYQPPPSMTPSVLAPWVRRGVTS